MNQNEDPFRTLVDIAAGKGIPSTPKADYPALYADYMQRLKAMLEKPPVKRKFITTGRK